MKTTNSNSFVVSSGLETPQAWIAIKRNRQKIYNSQGNSQVYLKDGQEFQIELFNPTQIKYLVKFKINGNYTSDRGLILLPGQRYFLDRFIDEDRKLSFSTYEVDNNRQTRKAIEKNGLLEVEFYAEVVYSGNSGNGINGYFNGYWGGSLSPTIQYQNVNLFSSGTSFGGTTFNTLTLSSGTTNSGISSISYTNSSDFTNLCSYSYDNIPSSNTASGSITKSIETGRVEKGEKSNQKFEDGYGSFYSWSSHTTKVKIIPLSQKPMETQEIRSYCTGCGSRIKKQTWKFCPNCGTETI
jgi:hypothetical protein